MARRLSPSRRTLAARAPSAARFSDVRWETLPSFLPRDARVAIRIALARQKTILDIADPLHCAAGGVTPAFNCVRHLRLATAIRVNYDGSPSDLHVRSFHRLPLSNPGFPSADSTPFLPKPRTQSFG